jgi:hypothetical protein
MQGAVGNPFGAIPGHDPLDRSRLGMSRTCLPVLARQGLSHSRRMHAGPGQPTGVAMAPDMVAALRSPLAYGDSGCPRIDRIRVMNGCSSVREDEQDNPGCEA